MFKILSKEMSKILITGASGEFGKATITSLLKKGVSPSNITALVRDENKASDLKSQGVNLAIGDYNDYDSLANAFKGIDKLFFISGNDVRQRDLQHSNVIKAAKEANVKHVIYTSMFRKTEDGSSPIASVIVGHITTEQWLKESGLPHTILLNNLYMDLLPIFIGDKVVENGAIYLTAEDGRAGVVLRSDMAEATAEILVSEGHIGKTYNFSNIEAFSFYDVAQVISEVTGKEIKYIPTTPEEYNNVFEKTGFHLFQRQSIINFTKAIAVGELNNTSSDVEKLLGRKPTTLKEYFSTLYGNK